MPTETASDQSFQHLTRNVSKIVDQLHKNFYGFRPNDTWAPSVNLLETEKDYLVCVDLAGVDKTKIDLEVVNNRLMLRGVREVPNPDEYNVGEAERGKIKVHVMEIDHGAFFREVELPLEVEQPKISAEYRNGMLWVILPKDSSPR